MTKSDKNKSPEDTKHSPPAAATAWGTWEELLLAYAVNRYGTKNWNSISSELQKRSSDPIHITPHHCEQKYCELKRRFSKSNDEMDDGAAIPWLEELRNIRVLELERELRNYDLYISCLQSKVKKLTEESEKTGGGSTKNLKLGLRNEVIEPENAKPVVPGEEDSDRESKSVNGSTGNIETGLEKSENRNGVCPIRTGDEKSEPVKSEPGREASGSITESKSEPGRNSDVQSSAGKFMEEGKDWVPRGSTKIDERDESTDSVPVRSLPLVDFLQRVRELGSVVFERRLDRQETIRYKNLIRQHIDYETLQTRLKEGWYSDGNDKFFRDLLLLATNTRVFFPKQSLEATAALDLRQLVLNEMISKKKQNSKLTKPTNLPLKRPIDPPDSLLLKPKLTGSGSIVVCKKRSSITAKGKKEQTEKLVEEITKKQQDSLPFISKKKGKSPVNETSDTKPDKKKKLTEAEEKKQSAAKFLYRMKRSNEPLLKSPEHGGSKNDVKGGEPKKSGGNKGKKSSSGRQVKEHGSPVKRSVGRPPKRAAASPPVARVSGSKRSRESVDLETLGSKQTKKRSKR